MQQIIYFFIKNKNFLIFVALFTLSVFFTIQTHNYHNDKFLNSANSFTGKIYEFRTNLTTYLTLGKENKKLIEENTKLHQELFKFREQTNLPIPDSLFQAKYNFLSARIIDNNYSATKNFLTINRGFSHGIKTDMGVISDKGLIGIIGKVSKKYAIIQSVLNTNSRINAKLLKSGHFGSLIWNGNSPQVVQLIDIPRIAEVKIGDTVVTGGRSHIFPEGILIGTVADQKPDENDDNYYNLEIQLFNDMTSLQFVYLIENSEMEEIQELEKEVEDGN